MKDGMNLIMHEKAMEYDLQKAISFHKKNDLKLKNSNFVTSFDFFCYVFFFR
jgi:hypothetical protein